MNTAREACMFGVMFGVLPWFLVPRLLGFLLTLNWNCLREISIVALSNVKLAAPFALDKAKIAMLGLWANNTHACWLTQ